MKTLDTAAVFRTSVWEKEGATAQIYEREGARSHAESGPMGRVGAVLPVLEQRKGDGGSTGRVHGRPLPGAVRGAGGSGAD
jgi:hypothetical protein